MIILTLKLNFRVTQEGLIKKTSLKKLINIEYI